MRWGHDREFGFRSGFHPARDTDTLRVDRHGYEARAACFHCLNWLFFRMPCNHFIFLNRDIVTCCVNRWHQTA